MNQLSKDIATIEEALNTLPYPQTTEGLFAPIRYELSLGGKRIRPALVLMACRLFGGDTLQALPSALAVEIFHNFTLLHDDLMDNADLRRGKPTVHCKWNNNTAILSGDAMQIMVYRELAKSPNDKLKKLLDIFSQTALEICQGQQLDMEYEERSDVSKEEYITMIRLKTAVLLGGALNMGAIVAEASERDATEIYQFGINIGIAFQLKDDLLDVYGNTASFGKNIGGDILNNKKTYLLLSAIEAANPSQRQEIETLLQLTDKDEYKIAAMTELYNRLGAPRICNEKMEEYYQQALTALENISLPKASKEPLLQLAKDLMQRDK